MSIVKSWTCSYCSHKILITTENFTVNNHKTYRNSKYGPVIIKTSAIICPNPDCGEIELTAELHQASNMRSDSHSIELIKSWNLLPESSVKIFPDYIPGALLNDYREACLILNKSAKASATLSRRCLQGIIRDFWNIQKPRLKDEIDALKDKIDPTTWSAIDAIRQIGNIGAHMEKDINLIIDVTQEEAELLISLIETIFYDWYIVKHEREQRLKKIISVSQEKQHQKENLSSDIKKDEKQKN